MLGVGIDWAKKFHLVAPGRSGSGVIEEVRVEHRPEAVAALVERIVGLDPAEVRLVIETRHGLLVEALVQAGYTVLPVNREAVSRRRGPAQEGRRRGRADLLPARPGPARRAQAADPATDKASRGW